MIANILGLPEAETTYRRALAMVEASKTPDEQIHSWILHDLGVFAMFKKDYRSAIAFSRASVQILERIYPENHPDLIGGLNGLGYVLLLAGERKEARGYLQHALDAQVRTLGPDDPNVGLILQSLGELERQDGQLDRARALLERSLMIMDKPTESEHPAAVELPGSRGLAGEHEVHLAETLVSLGLVDESEGHLAKAIDHLGRAHKIYSRFPGTVDDPAPDYARVLRKAGRIAEAEKIEASVKAAGTK